MDLVHQFLDFFRRNISGVLAGILKKAADDGRIRIAHLLHAVYVIQPRADDQRKYADGFFEMGNLFGGRLNARSVARYADGVAAALRRCQILLYAVGRQNRLILEPDTAQNQGVTSGTLQRKECIQRCLVPWLDMPYNGIELKKIAVIIPCQLKIQRIKVKFTP